MSMLLHIAVVVLSVWRNTMTSQTTCPTCSLPFIGLPHWDRQCEEIAALRKVVQAAERYRSEINHQASRADQEVFTCEAVLIDAVDEYRTRKDNE
jgi:hypothetical protein